MRIRLSLRSLATFALVAWLGSAHAASLDVTGAPGRPGPPGEAGDPGAVGAPGGDGGLADAGVDDPDPSNTAIAIGGMGGTGGAGGDGSPVGAGAGNGGPGGVGGSARASAMTDVPDDTTSALAHAQGGAGGLGGLGGTATGPGAPGAPGVGGDGGSGDASASAHSSGGSSAEANAFGGVGASGGAGGDAHSTALAQGGAQVSAHAVATAGLAGSPVAGSPLARDGDAWASSITTGDSRVRALSTAVGPAGVHTLAEAHAPGAVFEVRSQTSGGLPLLPSSVPAVDSFASIEEHLQPLGPAPFFLEYGIAAAYGKPRDGAAAEWLIGTQAQGVLEAGADLLALGYLGDNAHQRLDGEIEIQLATDAFDDPTGLTLAFFYPVALGELDLLHLEVSGNGQTLFELEFHDLASAQAALDDDLYDLGGSGLFDGDVVDLVLSFEIELHAPGAAFFTQFALLEGSVPEPAPLALLALVCLAGVARAGFATKRG